ncbi:diacylglycerol/lipid kinase family protein [Profundibacterium mesophilum]|uniref:Phosphoglycolate phosphatase n=1 Tax=Profundibacterium mesophilum KAUST100406-0324 TaxID=1037889 RepID=A0A921NRT0_9RHOB|nr:diacylglycerol kinase family protein [Profundibacterium mesophilum]KAF0676502.1 phosphoglycolate phosphatase [Profundibacterium mesophilum KAUST100406-0324]
MAPPSPDIAERICILLNPGSGHQGNAALVSEIEAFALRHSDRVTLRHLKRGASPAAAARAARGEGFGTVVAAGGDGTICGVAEGLHGGEARMGVLPMGTFNYFARGLKVPLEIGAALDLLLNGTAHPMRVAEVNGQIFLNNASLGVYPAILQKREIIYKRWGRSQLAAYWSVVLTLLGFRRSRRMKVTIDGVTHRRRTPLIFVARSAYQLEQFNLQGADLIRDGRFAVFLSPDASRWGLLRYAILLMGRSMTRHRDFELLDGTEIEVESHGRRHLVARDGERARMTAPIRFGFRDKALMVIMPESSDLAGDLSAEEVPASHAARPRADPGDPSRGGAGPGRSGPDRLAQNDRDGNDSGHGVPGRDDSGRTA